MRALVEEGIEYIFGYPGGAVLHIYDALYKEKKLKHVLARHEQGAIHAADGYARSTGKTGVVLVTSGPGATNAVTGIATAYMDSAPLVVLTGQVPRRFIGSDAFQEVDTLGITRPCVKHSFLVQSAEDIAPTLRKAFYIASTGRPGPVVVDIPKDITGGPGADAKAVFHYPKEIEMRSYKPTLTGHHKQIQQAGDMLLKAERPMIYSGGGVVWSNAHRELTELTQLLGAPITNTLMGLGCYPATDKQFVGMLGMHGTSEANLGMHHSDVLLAVGARFDDRVTGEIKHFCPKSKIIHIDIDPASISKNVRVHVPIVGDAGRVLQQLLDYIKPKLKERGQPDISKWWAQIDEWRKEDCLRFDRKGKLLKPQYVLERLWELTGGEAFVTSDVGQHQMWAAQFYKFDKPRRWINSGGLGTMGFGLPAALGVQLAHPGADVFCVTGEASILMCIQELSTLKQYNCPVKIINLNNRYMGMVRQWQEFDYESRYSQSYVDCIPDFVKVMESFGHVGLQITEQGEVDDAIKEAIKMREHSFFLDCIIDQSENVYPMIQSGKGHHEMKMSPLLDRELA